MPQLKITVEGPAHSGKTTILELIAQTLAVAGISFRINDQEELTPDQRGELLQNMGDRLHTLRVRNMVIDLEVKQTSVPAAK